MVVVVKNLVRVGEVTNMVIDAWVIVVRSGMVSNVLTVVTDGINMRNLSGIVVVTYQKLSW